MKTNVVFKTKLWRCLVPQRSSWTFASKCQEDEVLCLEDQDHVLKVKLCASMPPKQNQSVEDFMHVSLLRSLSDLFICLYKLRSLSQSITNEVRNYWKHNICVVNTQCIHSNWNCKVLRPNILHYTNEIRKYK